VTTLVNSTSGVFPINSRMDCATPLLDIATAAHMKEILNIVPFVKSRFYKPFSNPRRYPFNATAATQRPFHRMEI